MKVMHLLNKHRLSAVLLGFTALITQIVLLREFIVVSYGNELVIGIVLANWMLLTGIGSLLARFLKSTSGKYFLPIMQFLLGFLPVLTLFSIDFLRYHLYGYGMMINLLEVFIGSLILLLPFCFVSGMLFVLLSWEFSLNRKENLLNDTYAFESVGSIIGGLGSVLKSVSASALQCTALEPIGGRAVHCKINFL